MDDYLLDSIAKIIYDECILPDLDMPTFEDSKEKDLGGYERAVNAAKAVILKIRDK